MKKLCNSTACYFVAQGCKRVSSSKNGRFGYEMIGETQPEMELLEVVAFIYPFRLTQGIQSHLQPVFNSLTQHRCILCSVRNFSLKTLHMGNMADFPLHGNVRCSVMFKHASYFEDRKSSDDDISLDNELNLL